MKFVICVGPKWYSELTVVLIAVSVGEIVEERIIEVRPCGISTRQQYQERLSLSFSKELSQRLAYSFRFIVFVDPIQYYQNGLPFTLCQSAQRLQIAMIGSFIISILDRINNQVF